MEETYDDIAGKFSRGIALVSKVHKLSNLEGLNILLFTPIFVIVAMWPTHVNSL